MTFTAAAGQPKATARSAKAYCRAVDSRCSSTCCCVDCRTYTIASRCRCWSVTFSERSDTACGARRAVVSAADVAACQVFRGKLEIVALLIGDLLPCGRSQPLSQNPRQLIRVSCPSSSCRWDCGIRVHSRSSGTLVANSGGAIVGRGGGRKLPCEASLLVVAC